MRDACNDGGSDAWPSGRTQCSVWVTATNITEVSGNVIEYDILDKDAIADEKYFSGRNILYGGAARSISEVLGCLISRNILCGAAARIVKRM